MGAHAELCLREAQKTRRLQRRTLAAARGLQRLLGSDDREPGLAFAYLHQSPAIERLGDEGRLPCAARQREHCLRVVGRV